jgi:two-component system KDP operon response regulator KdpE
VVDADRAILRALAVNLRARGYDVMLASSGCQALATTARWHPDLVMLDLDLPDLAGIDIIEGLRGWTDVPIVVVSARSAESVTVAALDAGANDFVAKPFGIGELMARVRAALRVHRRLDEVSVGRPTISPSIWQHGAHAAAARTSG